LEICADAKCIHSPLDSLKGVLDEYNHTQVLLSSKKLDSYHMPLPGVCIMKALDDDMNFNSSFKDHINSTNGNGVKAWDALIAHPLIRKDVATLTSASKILDNTGIVNIISKTDLQSAVQKLASKGVRCRTCASGNPFYRYMDEILDDLEHGATKFGDSYKSVVTGIKQGNNFTEGAIFVADAVKRYGDDFPSNSVFEFTTKTTADNIRRVDVKVPNGFNGNKDVFFEFKSVLDVPPSGFATQFVKDMDLPDVTDLNQLKWWFDGKKVNSLPKQDFIDALEGATISQDIINKLVKTGPKTKEALIDLIDDDFDLIFFVK